LSIIASAASYPLATSSDTPSFTSLACGGRPPVVFHNARASLNAACLLTCFVLEFFRRRWRVELGCGVWGWGGVVRRDAVAV
jgi:hypothetical protein